MLSILRSNLASVVGLRVQKQWQERAFDDNGIANSSCNDFSSSLAAVAADRRCSWPSDSRLADQLFGADSFEHPSKYSRSDYSKHSIISDDRGRQWQWSTTLVQFSRPLTIYGRRRPPFRTIPPFRCNLPRRPHQR